MAVSRKYVISPMYAPFRAGMLMVAVMRRRESDGLVVGQETMRGTDGIATRGFDRRRFLRLTAGAGLALATATALHALPAAASEAHYRTITALKLRASASSKGKVKLVMPTGAIVDDLGYAKNGYIKVRYQGTGGWAKAEYLGPVDPDFDPLLNGEAVTTDTANLRGGPSTGDAVILVVPAGSSIQVSDSIVDGFRYVAFDGTPGWLFDDYIAA